MKLAPGFLASNVRPIEAGIYALLLDGEVLYVGQSVNIAQRVSNHLAEKTFDSYAILARVTTTPRDLDAKLRRSARLDRLEDDNIHAYHPVLNKTPCVRCKEATTGIKRIYLD